MRRLPEMAEDVSPQLGSQTLVNEEQPPEYTERRPVSVNTPSTSSSDIVNSYQMGSNCDQIYGLQCEESCSQSHPGLLTHADRYNIPHGFDPNSDLTSLDSNLQNLPKELYVEKLLEITKIIKSLPIRQAAQLVLELTPTYLKVLPVNATHATIFPE